jgi:hypothetical protein
MAKHPDEIWLEVGKERFKVRAESLEGPERAEALARIAAIAPRYGTYQQKSAGSSSCISTSNVYGRFCLLTYPPMSHIVMGR